MEILDLKVGRSEEGRGVGWKQLEEVGVFYKNGKDWKLDLWGGTFTSIPHPKINLINFLKPISIQPSIIKL